MMDISGFGFQLRIIASVTFPIGFTIDEFSDDADPFDMPDLQIADVAMGSNGDLITWAKANAMKPTVSVLPGGLSDTNLSILLEANRVGRGKTGARDLITLVGIYPDGSFDTLINGIITNGMPIRSIASAGRIKTRTYGFAFENKIGI